MSSSKYNIEFTATALDDFKALRAVDRAKIEDAIETYLRYEPDKISKSRIKRLRGTIYPQYRPRIDNIVYFMTLNIKLNPKRTESLF